MVFGNGDDLIDRVLGRAPHILAPRQIMDHTERTSKGAPYAGAGGSRAGKQCRQPLPGFPVPDAVVAGTVNQVPAGSRDLVVGWQFRRQRGCQRSKLRRVHRQERI